MLNQSWAPGGFERSDLDEPVRASVVGCLGAVTSSRDHISVFGQVPPLGGSGRKTCSSAQRASVGNRPAKNHFVVVAGGDRATVQGRAVPMAAVLTSSGAVVSHSN